MRHILLILTFALLVSCNDRRNKSSGHRKTNDATTNTKLSLDRSSYSLQYFIDWTIDSSKKLENVETHFTLHSPLASGLITFFIFDYSQDESESLERHVKAQLNKSMPNGVVKYITNWGNYKGHGAIIKGNNTASMPSKLVIFIASIGERSFTITSVYADEYEDEVLPGLNLIESSFRMKEQ